MLQNPPETYRSEDELCADNRYKTLEPKYSGVKDGDYEQTNDHLERGVTSSRIRQ